MVAVGAVWDAVRLHFLAWGWVVVVLGGIGWFAYKYLKGVEIDIF